MAWIKLFVGNCQVDRDGSSLSDYVYDVHMRINSKDITIQRSYLDFCDFDTHLLRNINEVTLPECPLQYAEAIRRYRIKQSDPFGALRRVTIGGDASAADNSPYVPYFSDDRSSYMRTMFEIEEDATIKSSDLTQWLIAIFSEPSVLELPVSARFLNPEEDCFRRNSAELDVEMSEFDFLVPSKGMKSKQLLSKFAMQLEVQQGQILVWRFRSRTHDVAFGIEINGDPVLSSRRFASSKEEVRGVMQVPDSVSEAVCELKFDNKYAGMLAATALTYNCRAVEGVEFSDSRRRAHEKNVKIRQKVDACEQIYDVLSKEAKAIRTSAIDGTLHPNSQQERFSPGGCSSRTAISSAYNPSSVIEENKALKDEVAALKQEVKELKAHNALLQRKLNSSATWGKSQSQDITTGVLHMGREANQDVSGSPTLQNRISARLERRRSTGDMEEDFDAWYLKQFGQSVNSRDRNSAVLADGLKKFAQKVSTIFKVTEEESDDRQISAVDSGQSSNFSSPSRQPKSPYSPSESTDFSPTNSRAYANDNVEQDHLLTGKSENTPQCSPVSSLRGLYKQGVSAVNAESTTNNDNGTGTSGKLPVSADEDTVRQTHSSEGNITPHPVDQQCDKSNAILPGVPDEDQDSICRTKEQSDQSDSSRVIDNKDGERISSDDESCQTADEGIAHESESLPTDANKAFVVGMIDEPDSDDEI